MRCTLADLGAQARVALADPPGVPTPGWTPADPGPLGLAAFAGPHSC